MFILVFIVIVFKLDVVYFLILMFIEDLNRF